jgi:hypothetical protein
VAIEGAQRIAYGARGVGHLGVEDAFPSGFQRVFVDHGLLLATISSRAEIAMMITAEAFTTADLPSTEILLCFCARPCIQNLDVGLLFLLLCIGGEQGDAQRQDGQDLMGISVTGAFSHRRRKRLAPHTSR